MTDDVRNVDVTLATISEHWQPHRLTSVNDYDVTVTCKECSSGTLIPDSHEVGIVIRSELTIQLRDRDVVLGPNDIFVIRAIATNRPFGERTRTRADLQLYAAIVGLVLPSEKQSLRPEVSPADSPTPASRPAATEQGRESDSLRRIGVFRLVGCGDRIASGRGVFRSV